MRVESRIQPVEGMSDCVKRFVGFAWFYVFGFAGLDKADFLASTLCGVFLLTRPDAVVESVERSLPMRKVRGV